MLVDCWVRTLVWAVEKIIRLARLDQQKYQLQLSDEQIRGGWQIGESDVFEYAYCVTCRARPCLDQQLHER